MAVWKVFINNTYEYVNADTPEEAIRKAKEMYMSQLKDSPEVIEVSGVVML